MNRKRGTYILPEEMQTNERLSTKKELAQKGRQPTCPVPVKLRRSLRARHSNKKPTPLCFNNNVTLSPIYDPKQRRPYLDQVFSKFGCMGEGSFGKVYRVRSKEDKKLYAVKRLKANVSFKDRYAEVKNNETIGFNPNFVQYFMSWEENSDTFMLLEYCDMSLADYSKLNNDIPEELLWNVLYDICKALDFLHKRNFLHLDVKPGNIMIQKGSFKLGDFGLLVDLQMNDHVHKSTLSDGDSKYLALEVLDGIYTSACDIFGLGLSILELATDIELPDRGILWHQLRHKILPLWFYDRVTSGLSIIVERMISTDHKERPSAEKILSYPGVKDIAKRDTKLPRTDFAASFIKPDDSYDNLPLSPIHFNGMDNNTTTPPCNIRTALDNDYEDDYGITRDSDEENSIKFSGRKSLFSRLSDRFPSSDHSSSMLNPMADPEMENGLLAQSLSDSGMECENSDESSSLFISHKKNEDPFIMKALITSTPVLKAKQVRRIPKTKLHFD